MFEAQVGGGGHVQAVPYCLPKGIGLCASV